LTPRRVREVVAERWQSEANLTFFLALLVVFVFVLPSLGLERKHEQLYGDVVSSLLLITGAAIAWQRRTVFFLAAGIVGVTVALKWAALLAPSAALGIGSRAATIVAIVMVVHILLSRVFAPGPVTTMRLQGAVAVYLLLGLGWSHAYALVASIIPGSFSLPGHDVSDVVEWAYYSFVTLTTTGFGDILPVHPVARALTIGEVVTGQLYLAILIGRLVGMQISAELRARERGSIQIATSPAGREAEASE
jgi:hypothetical protein